jgi:hypothetical protein
VKPPGWITSLGALVALATSAAGFFRESGTQAEAQRRSDEADKRVNVQLDRMWDAQRANRAEVTTSLRREIDLACACCQNR